MEKLSCNGEWTLLDPKTQNSYPAQVPGCVHTDLLSADVIPDPWYRDNEKDVHWVCEQDWVYERKIEVSESLLAHARVLLNCEGLDTFASVQVNGIEVLKTDNMFRTWEVDVKSELVLGENTLRVEFTSPIPYMKERDDQLRLYCWNLYHEDFWGKSYVRKMACSFGWDWGLMAPTAGIWRDIELVGYDARIEDLKINQSFDSNDEWVDLDLSLVLEGESDRLKVELRKKGESEPVLQEEHHTAYVFSDLSVQVESPELWWPNGMGDQPLYELELTLMKEGKVLDVVTRQIGFRTLELIRQPDKFGESFRFRVNGREVFSKGGNWIPCDVFPSRISDETYRHLLTSAADSHMNMIRVWGGGIYEDERFYDLCDELGLMVWQDFMFACSTYPGFDDDFIESVREEAIDNVSRLHHRACLAVWCGNNEIEQGLVKWTDDGWDDRHMPESDYKRLFDELLPSVVEAYDGVTAYWPSSAHTPGSERPNCYDSRRGDVHAWSVWFGGQPIEAQRDWDFRFMSEFGFQSFPELKTVESFTLPEDRALTGWIMDYHQRSQMGNQTIFKYMLDWFSPPKDLEHTLWLTQLIHGICVMYAAEHSRRIQGQMDGLLYWQINDIWPGATWASIDVYGRWKALQYMATHFFEPVHVSLLEDKVHSTMEIHVSNHNAEDGDYMVEWGVMSYGGEVFRSGQESISVASQTNEKVITLDCTEERSRGGGHRLPLSINNDDYRPYSGDKDLLVYAVVLENGVEISRNIAHFVRPKHLSLPNPEVEISAEGVTEQSFEVTLSVSQPAPWLRLDFGSLEAKATENWLHLLPGRPKTITLDFDQPISHQEVMSALKAVPLQDHWS